MVVSAAIAYDVVKSNYPIFAAHKICTKSTFKELPKFSNMDLEEFLLLLANNISSKLLRFEFAHQS